MSSSEEEEEEESEARSEEKCHDDVFDVFFGLGRKEKENPNSAMTPHTLLR